MRWGTLFSGVGGVEFGLQAAGHRTVWAVEMDAIAAEYHRRNHPATTVYEADVTIVDVTELANIDCLWASPPCQGHSTARRSDLPAREDVWVGRDILRYVAELQPRVVMIENVPGYASHPVCKEITAALWKMGYTVESRIIDCADYGIPQTRKRLIIQARLDGQISWPRKAVRRVGWYEAIADILPPPEKPLAPWQAKRWDDAYGKLGPVYVNWQFAAARDPEHNKTVMTNRHDCEPATTITAHSDRQEVVYPILLDGQFIYGTNEQGEKSLRLLASDEPSSTITASASSEKGRCAVYPVAADNQHGYDNQLRLMPAHKPISTVMASGKSGKYVIFPASVPMRARLNARCCARLQTFPDSLILPGVFDKAIRLIGNAVPPRLAQLLAECAEAGADVWQGSLFGMEAA